MRIMRARVYPLRLEFVHPLKTARATYAARDGFVMNLLDEAKRGGRGEAMPLPEFGTESREDCERLLGEYMYALRGRDIPETLEGLTESLRHLTGHPAARHAVEQALLDLLARRRGLPLSQLLSEEAREEVQVNALLGAATPELLALEARRAVAEGYETLKIKVGGRPLAEDVARLFAVREAVGPDVRLRVDPNGAWTESEAVLALNALKQFRLELCEQPVAAGELEALRRMSTWAPCRLAADESLAVPGAVRALLDNTPTVNILVLKPMVLGGLLPTLEVAREAARKGLDAYVTSSLDGVVARAGAAHLAAALPSGRYASGLGVGHLFKDEPENHPFRPVRGRILLPRTPGQGVP
jgi:o-succinylbenzoate synthase